MIDYELEPGDSSITCGAELDNLTNFINFFTCTLIDSVIPLLVALAVAAFVYGIIKYFLSPDSEEKKKEGKSYMFWGLVTLFVMVSIWGLVGIFSNTFLTGNDSERRPILPGLPVK